MKSALLLLLSASIASGFLPFVTTRPMTFPTLFPWIPWTTRPPWTPSTTTQQAQSSCRCGVAKFKSSRIVGGVNALKNEFPWQVLLPRMTGMCGGTLLSSTTVLTAAHCYERNHTGSAVFSEHNRVVADGEIRKGFAIEFYIPISSWKLHPKYDPSTHDYDFAVITLSREVPLNNNVYPICLPSDLPKSYDDRESIISGWGHLILFGTSPSILQKAVVNTMPNANCTEPATRYSPSKITENMICAAAPGKDTCQNDSGGPLITKSPSTGRYELIGVTSWGYGCAHPNAPGVYARVTRVLPWIRRTGRICPQ